MKIAFCLFEYSPYSGLSLDFRRILLESLERGHDVHVFVSAWHGKALEGVPFTLLPAWRFASNHTKNKQFHDKLRSELTGNRFDIVVGFNKMPGLDVYYGADICYVGRTEQHPALLKLGRRYKRRKSFEAAVFGLQSKTLILSLSERQKSEYQEHYFTPNERFHLLPPTLDSSFSPIADRAGETEKLRQELEIPVNDLLLMFIGSGFATKGLDRAILALASLPMDLQKWTSLIVVGDDDENQYRKQAEMLKVSRQVRFLGGRSRADIPKLLAAGDLMVHPAYGENTGTVLLEAIAAGLPVLATDACGYAGHIKAAGAGTVLDSPFEQDALNTRLVAMLTSPDQASWSTNGQRYGKDPALYQMPSKAVDAIEGLKSDLRSSSRTTQNDGDIRNVYLREDLSAFDFDQLMAIGKSEPGGQHRVHLERDKLADEGRRTVSFSHNGRRYYLKIHDGVGWKEIGKNLTSLRLPVLGAENEWRGVHHLHRQTLLQNLGLDTLEIAGYGTRKRHLAKVLNDPARRQSLIVTDEIPQAKSLEELCAEWGWERSVPKTPQEIRLKHWLIKQLAQTARILHDSGANHRDFYLSHFLLHRTEKTGLPSPENCRIFLIDLHRMRVHKPPLRAWIRAVVQDVLLKRQRPRTPQSETPSGWKMRDVSGLHYSSRKLGLTRSDLIRFMSAYENTSRRQVLKSLKNNSRFWRKVQKRALNLHKLEQRRARNMRKAEANALTTARTQH
ncbi:MAG: lipopolysaccharide core heptose(I) kinase RfaP, partial [Pseudomonadota bacterium]|nr:lipopolysaccharide core heptose(I) kinase RfaP [Pseudomonadota bacterium]